ncbi:PREDICTED: gamma-secretase subunit APH-1B [Mandrillus leucophaeus]|uniref:gamma-secretase subunit APH-1B n=1 Tax=Mandrillus leucophaeus TaxID=9568 RepID=UPI0005F3A9EF|nr:PREDICTED: gamma-secretase subunit APH-1B [Mandrillus leucophaeus]
MVRALTSPRTPASAAGAAACPSATEHQLLPFYDFKLNRRLLIRSVNVTLFVSAWFLPVLRTQHGVLQCGLSSAPDWALQSSQLSLTLHRVFLKASEGLKSINPGETAPSMRLLAYVSGLGFGIMSGVFSFVNTLSDSLGPGTVGIHGDSPQFFLYSGMSLIALRLSFGFGSPPLSVAATTQQQPLAGFDLGRDPLPVLGKPGDGSFCAGRKPVLDAIAVLQTFISSYYGINLVSAFIILVLMGTWAFFVAGGSCRSLKLCLLCQDKDFLLYNQRSR